VIDWLDIVKDLVIIGYTTYKWYKRINTRQKKKRSQAGRQKKR